MAICGEKRTGGAPPGGAHEWNQRFEFGGLLQDFMDHPLQITLTSTGDSARPPPNLLGLGLGLGFGIGLGSNPNLDPNPNPNPDYSR